MPVPSRQTIDEVRRRANLVEVAGRYTTLKKAGREYRGLSPFTEEKTPSFFVNPEKNAFYCFSTQEAGDVIGFVRKLESFSFSEAIEHLAEKFGIQVEYEKGGPSRQEVSLRKRLFEVHEQAASFFQSAFRAENDEGRRIRSYWTEDRRFSLETATDVGIGLAPVDPVLFPDFLRKKNFSDEVLDASGLFFERRHPQGRFFPRFRGRLMIPVRDVQGRVVAFTARVTPLTPEDDKTRDAKYVNSPETPLFQKRRIVFGLERAGKEVRGGKPLLLVEGQLDVIRCWEAGFPEAIALQGTAAGAEQLGLIRRFTDGAVVLLDGDRAGQDAAFKLLPLGFEADVDLKFASLPAGSDPDDLLMKDGPEALRNLQETALPPMKFALNVIAPDPGTMDPAARANACGEVFELIRHVKSGVLREEYLDFAARHLRFDPEALRGDYRRFSSGRSPAREEGTAPRSDLQLTEHEEVLLFLLLHFSDIRESLTQLSICEWITNNTTAANLLRRFAAEISEGSFESIDEFRDHCESDEEESLLNRLLARVADVRDPLSLASQSLRELVREFASREISSLVDQMNSVPVGDPRLKDLQRRRRELRILHQQPPDLPRIS